MVKRFVRTAISGCIAWLVAGSPMLAAAEPNAEAPDERPRAALRPSPAPRPSERTHLLGVRLDLGMAFGGDELHAGTLTIEASSGVSAGLGVTFMPLWFAGHGVGISLEAGYKYDGGQNINGGVGIHRFPLLAGLEALLHIVDTVFVRLAGGAEWHTGIQLWGTGMAGQGMEFDFPDALGLFVQGGPAFRTGSFLLDLALRYTSMEYDATPDVDASNVSLHMAFQYLVL